MVHGLMYSSNILDTFGVLSSFSFAETIWNKYEKYAIPKIADATLKVRGALFYIKDLTAKQAEDELSSLERILPIIGKFKSTIEPIDGQEFQHFRNAAFEFFSAINLLHLNLQDVAQIHSSYEMSMPVLANDWDSKEDDHWDKY